jgi:hypothetical protein
VPAPDRTRISLFLMTALWLSAIVILFIGFRLRLKPVMLVGFLDLFLAIGATALVFTGRDRSAD